MFVLGILNWMLCGIAGVTLFTFDKKDKAGVGILLFLVCVFALNGIALVRC